MKTKTFETSKANLIFIDLPENIKAPFVYCWLQYRYLNDKNISAFSFDLPNNTNFEVLGFLKELTEEQKESIVELFLLNELAGYKRKYYPVYGTENDSIHNDGRQFNSKTKNIETCFDSLLKRQEVYLENAFGNNPPHNIGLIDMLPTGDKITEASLTYAKKWQDFEEKVFRNPVILVEFKN